MAELNKKDFTKPCSKGPYAGKSRLEACKLKIKDKKPFIVGKNASGRKVYATAITPTWPHTLNAGKERISITKIFNCDPEPECSPNATHTMQSGGGSSDKPNISSILNK